MNSDKPDYDVLRPEPSVRDEEENSGWSVASEHAANKRAR
jgi:hypothetical protein